MRFPPGLLVAASALAVAGCAPMQWVKADATPAQASTDAAECQQAAWREAQLRAWHYHPIAPLMFRDRLGHPYFAWPHGPFSDPFGNHFMEESRLAQFCMRSKGYELVPVPVEPKKSSSGGNDPAFAGERRPREAEPGA